MRKHGLSLVLLLLALGCASAPDRRPPSLDLAVPENWIHTPGSVDTLEDSWWRSFQDPRLEEVISLALEHNYDLQAAAARLQQAAASATIAGADLTPSLDFNFNASRRRQNFIGLPFPGGGGSSSTTNSFGISLDLSWELDLWGRLRSGAAAGLADFQAAEADLYGARLSLIGQTVKAWFAAAEACQQLDLAEKTVESFRKSTSQVRSRYLMGIRPPLDLRLSLANLADAEALLAQRRLDLDVAKAQLELLLGRYPDRTILSPAALPGLPPEIPSGLPAELIARRPDLVAAERRLAASDARLAVAEKNLYPRLSLTASGGTASDELDDLLDGDFRVWALAGNLTYPIFHGERLAAEEDRARAGSQEVLANYAQGVLRAYAEVESALAAEKFLAGAEEHLTEATRQSEAAQRLAEDRYQAGLENYVIVLESQRRALVNQRTLLQLRRQRLENRVDLFLALGGGFHLKEQNQTEDPS